MIWLYTEHIAIISVGICALKHVVPIACLGTQIIISCIRLHPASAGYKSDQLCMLDNQTRRLNNHCNLQIQDKSQSRMRTKLFFIALLQIAALHIYSCFSAPLMSALSPSAPVTPNEGGHAPTATSLANVEDVMMDPTAKMRKLFLTFCQCQSSKCYQWLILKHFVAWQKQEGDITYLTDKFLFPEDLDDPFFTLPANGQRSKRAAVKDRYKLWPNGVIPYEISSAYDGTMSS